MEPRRRLMDESSSFNHTDEDSTKKLMEEEIDKISGLSDPVLHHILSFLPTKYSVRTSILSSRWRHLWASVPILRFDQKDFIVKPHFMNFVEGVLFLRDWSLPVRKVRLRCYDGAEFFRTTTWIRVLSRRSGLQELDLGAHPSPLDLHALPAELFRLNSLVKLKLNLHCHCSLVVPSVIHLNNLKSLHLKWVQFEDDQSVARLLSGCPQLEELIIEECNRVSLHNIVISGRFLKKFTMIETTNDEDDYDYYEDEVHGCMLTIDAPNLVVLNCYIEMPPAIIVGRLPCMEAADINLKSHDRDDNSCHIMCELLKGVCETKVLRLSNSSMEYLSLVKGLPDRLTAFNKLKYLKLTRVCLTNAHIWVMFIILKNSPYLKSLSFVICEDACWIGRNQLVDSKNISSGDIFRNLETLEIGNFRGIQREFALLKFILVNAKSLRSLNITLKDTPRDTLEQMRIRGRLMKYSSSTPSIALRLF